MVENMLSLLDDLLRPPIVKHVGGEQGDAAVMVLVVIPAKERLTERPRILEGPETIRELGAVLEGLELTFRVRIVVGDMGATVGLGDPKVGQEEGHRLGGHRGSAIRMEIELTRKDPLLLAGIGNQPLGELCDGVDVSLLLTQRGLSVCQLCKGLQFCGVRRCLVMVGVTSPLHSSYGAISSLEVDRVVLRTFYEVFMPESCDFDSNEHTGMCLSERHSWDEARVRVVCQVGTCDFSRQHVARIILPSWDYPSLLITTDSVDVNKLSHPPG